LIFIWARKPFNGAFQETDPFGPRVHPVLKILKFHNGIDFGLPLGTPVIACVDGRIESGFDSIDGYWIKLHFMTEARTKGFFLYDHLSKVDDVKKVKAGDEIGKSGGSGRVTGTCLHFGLFLMLNKDKEYKVVNPKQYVNFA
jgi:murein DD-endopeptidase MepM/ murein hydrolase activator NlpD